MFEKVSKRVVLKEVRDKGFFEGYIAPSKVAPEHLAGSLGLGVPMHIRMVGDEYIFITSNENHPLEMYLHFFKTINCNSKFGHRIRFWREVT